MTDSSVLQNRRSFSDRDVSGPPPGVEQAIDDWLASRRSELTRIAYAPVAAEWIDWLASRGVDPLQATRRDGDDWRIHLQALRRPSGKIGLGPRTVARKLATVASLYDYLAEQKMLKDPGGWPLEVSPMSRVERPEISRRQGTTAYLIPSDAARVLAAAEAAGDRTHVAVGLLLKVAVRANEVLTLDCSALRTHGTTLTVTVRRKGGWDDIQPLTERLAHDVTSLKDGRMSGPLLARSKDGTAPWTYSQLLTAVSGVGRAAGLAERLTPHVLRVTWATTALDAGVPLDRVQDVMGHASANTTRLYDRGRGDLDRKLEAMLKVEARIRGAGA